MQASLYRPNLSHYLPIIMTQPISIYQSPDGSINLDVQVEKETIWLNLQQIADLFERNKSSISRHIKNIYSSQELEEKSVVAKIATTASDGKTYQVDYYNLDMIISIGYRVDSVRATQTLRWHIVDGYTINEQRIQQNYQSFLDTVSQVQKLVDNTNLNPSDILKLIKTFGQTRFSLDSYDKGTIPTTWYTQDSVALEASKLYNDIAIFKNELVQKEQATDLFAQEKQKGKSWRYFWFRLSECIWRRCLSYHRRKSSPSLIFYSEKSPLQRRQ